jgi:hypothetical protein
VRVEVKGLGAELRLEDRMDGWIVRIAKGTVGLEGEAFEGTPPADVCGGDLLGCGAWIG